MSALTRYYLLRLWRLSWGWPVAGALYVSYSFVLLGGLSQPCTACVLLMLLASYGAAVGMSLFGRDENDLALPYSRIDIFVCRLRAATVFVFASLPFGLVPLIVAGGAERLLLAVAQALAFGLYGVGLLATLCYLKSLSISGEVEEHLYARLGLLVTGIIALIGLLWMGSAGNTGQMVLRICVVAVIWGIGGAFAGEAAYRRYQRWEVIPAEKRKESLRRSWPSDRAIQDSRTAPRASQSMAMSTDRPLESRPAGRLVQEHCARHPTLVAWVSVVREVCAGPVVWVHLSYAVVGGVIAMLIPPVGVLVGLFQMSLTFACIGLVGVLRTFLNQVALWSALPLPRDRLFACFSAPVLLCALAFVGLGMTVSGPTVSVGTFTDV